MNIGIIGAMDEEVAQLKQTFAPMQALHWGGGQFWRGQYAGCHVVLLKSGIGKVNAAMNTTTLIQRFQPDAIINIGSAGGFDPGLNVGDVVISSQVCHHDVDIAIFGYDMGQIPGEPARFQADPRLIRLARQAFAKLHAEHRFAQPSGSPIQAKEGLIASGDQFVYKTEAVATMRHHFPDMMAVEMEAAAVAQVCHANHTPFVVVRALSDIAGRSNPLSFEDFLPYAAQNSSVLVAALIQGLVV